MSSRVRVAGFVVAGIVVAALVTAVAVTQVRQDEALPGVSIEGIDVGGLGEEDTRAVVDDYVAQRSGEQIVLVYDDSEFAVDPVDVGAGLDVDAVVDRALEAGREGSFFAARWAALTGVDIDVEASVELDDDAVTDRIDEIAEEVDTEPVEGDVSIDPATLEAVTVDPVDGVTTLVPDAVTLVREAFDEPGPDRRDLPVEEQPTRTDDDDVATAAAQATAAVAADLVLRSDEGAVVIPQRELATMISSRIVGDDDARIVLVVTRAAVKDVVLPVVDPLLRTPVDASFDAPRVPPVTFDDRDDATWEPVPADIAIVPGRPGTEIDNATIADQLTGAVRNAQREVVLTLSAVPPSFTQRDAEDASVDTLLSTFTTYHSCCANRVLNIQRLADLVDDTVVDPGEQFSINQISGIRTCESGFAQAGMILDGEIVDVCGGGVSQFGTTTINAVFFSGLDPDAYKPHSFYISRYPMAREATLNYPSPDIDVRFTNDTSSPVIVRTTYTGTSITVSFYGHSDVTRVAADLGSTSNVRSYSTDRRVNESLTPGTSQVVQSGQNGFSVGLTRTVTREGGETSSDDWSNTYVAKREIVEYNPVEPDDEPTTTPAVFVPGG